MHLFDIDVKGGIRFKESDVLSPGDKLLTFNVLGLKIGVGICYDIRFEELARIYRAKGRNKNQFIEKIWEITFEFQDVIC